MKRAFWAAIAGVLVLAGCGAGEPPRTANPSLDLSEFWQSAP